MFKLIATVIIAAALAAAATAGAQPVDPPRPAEPLTYRQAVSEVKQVDGYVQDCRRVARYHFRCHAIWWLELTEEEQLPDGSWTVAYREVFPWETRVEVGLKGAKVIE